MKMEKILFPTQFRELAFNTLESLFPLKEAGLREIVLYHVIPRDEVAFVPFGGYLKEEEERLREEARIRFEDWQKALEREGIGSRAVIEVGDPAPRILSLAGREEVDLIVMGKKRKAEIEELFIGSPTVDILRRACRPVLVHKYMVQFEWGGETVTRTNDRIFERPLLATDWSPASGRALELLLTLGKAVKKAMVTHIIGSKIARGVEKPELSRLEQESEARLEQHCRILREAGIDAESHLSAGNEVQEIIQVSREFNASMIIAGTTGRDFLHKLILGSISHRLAELSELPTLLIP